MQNLVFKLPIGHELSYSNFDNKKKSTINLQNIASLARSLDYFHSFDYHRDIFSHPSVNKFTDKYGYIRDSKDVVKEFSDLLRSYHKNVIYSIQSKIYKINLGRMVIKYGVSKKQVIDGIVKDITAIQNNSNKIQLRN